MEMDSNKRTLVVLQVVYRPIRWVYMMSNGVICVRYQAIGEFIGTVEASVPFSESLC